MSRSTRLASAGLVAAAVLAIAACGSSSSSGGVAGATGSPATSAAPPASASAPASPETSAAPSGAALNQAFLQFEPQNDSNITGGAILTDLGENQTAVTIGVVAAGVTEPMPANIVPSDCASAEPGEAASPAPSAAASAPAESAPAESAAASLDPTTILKLGDLAAGSSNTVLALTLDSLTESPHAVVIYRSPADGTIVACADITR